MSFLSKPLVTTSFTFGVDEINCLKKQCTTSSFNKIKTFEVVTAHTWRSFVKSGDLPLSQSLKLCFTFNFRKKMKLPEGYYGNGFVRVCAESTVKDLLVSANNLDHCVKLVQQAKDSVDEEYVRSTINVLKDKTVITDPSSALIFTHLRQIGLDDVDFGEGKPLHLSPPVGKLFCAFLSVIGDPKAVRVCISLPKTMEGKFQHYMTEIESWD